MIHRKSLRVFGSGLIFGIGLYEVLRKIAKNKKIDGKKLETKVLYLCPRSLYSLFESVNGLKSAAARKIEELISDNKIKDCVKSGFYFGSIEPKYEDIVEHLLVTCNCQYTAALYVIDGTQKKLFEDNFQTE
jgi:hypothetical protein